MNTRLTSILALAAIALVPGCGENRTLPGPSFYAPGTEPGLACIPNLDGMLEAGEVTVAIGETVSYLASPSGVTRPVRLDGDVDLDGRRSWDFASDFADDRIVAIGPSALSDQWFAYAFPDGDYVAPVDLEGTVLGVYHLDERALWLHGVASREENPAEGQTLLPYDAPVPIYRFPFEPNDRYTVTGTISEGTLLGLAYRGEDTYEVDVVGAGRIDLPDWSFGQAWRVDQQVTVTPAIGEPVTRHLASWFFECFGEVARAESANGVTGDFTDAVSLRRLTLREP
ncbi:MAG: hypothetical protein AB7S26_09735 [Sandaracinaceae bacterium]